MTQPIESPTTHTRLSQRGVQRAGVLCLEGRGWDFSASKILRAGVPSIPQDIPAGMYQHLRTALDTYFSDGRGLPIAITTGTSIKELL